MIDFDVDEIADAAVASGVDEVRRRIESVVCPEHGKGPADLRLVRGPDGEMSFSYTECCPAHERAISARLAEMGDVNVNVEFTVE